MEISGRTCPKRNTHQLHASSKHPMLRRRATDFSGLPCEPITIETGGGKGRTHSISRDVKWTRRQNEPPTSHRARQPPAPDLPTCRYCHVARYWARALQCSRSVRDTLSKVQPHIAIGLGLSRGPAQPIYNPSPSSVTFGLPSFVPHSCHIQYRIPELATSDVAVCAVPLGSSNQGSLSKAVVTEAKQQHRKIQDWGSN
jgi:hypothetical protein